MWSRRNRKVPRSSSDPDRWLYSGNRGCRFLLLSIAGLSGVGDDSSQRINLLNQILAGKIIK